VSYIRNPSMPYCWESDGDAHGASTKLPMAQFMIRRSKQIDTIENLISIRGNLT